MTKQSFKKNTIYIAIANIVPQAIKFGLLVYLSHILSVNDFGTIEFVGSLVLFLIPLSSLNIQEAVFRFSSNISNKEAGDYLLNGAFVIIFVSIPFGLVFTFVNELFHTVDSKLIIYLFLWVISQSLFNISVQFYRALGKVVLFSIYSILRVLILLIATIILINNYNIDLYFITVIFSFGVIAFIVIIYHYIFKKSKVNIEILTSMIRYSSPFIISALMWYLMDFSDKISITLLLGINEFAIYSFATKIPSLIVVFKTIFMSSWQLTALKNYENKNYSEIYNKYMNNIFLFIIFLGMLVNALVKTFLIYFATEPYQITWMYTSVLILAFTFSSFSTLLGVNYIVYKEPKYSMITASISAVANIVMNIVLILLFNLIGAAIATTLSYFILFIIRKRSCDLRYKKLMLSKNVYLGIFLIFVQIILLWIFNYMWILLLSFVIMFVYILMNKNVIFDIMKGMINYDVQE